MKKFVCSNLYYFYETNNFISHQIDLAFIESTSKKTVGFIIGSMVENKLYYPVHTEMITEIHEWNNWFIIGWHVYNYIIL